MVNIFLLPILKHYEGHAKVKTRHNSKFARRGRKVFFQVVRKKSIDLLVIKGCCVLPEYEGCYQDFYFGKRCTILYGVWLLFVGWYDDTCSN